MYTKNSSKIKRKDREWSHYMRPGQDRIIKDTPLGQRVELWELTKKGKRMLNIKADQLLGRSLFLEPRKDQHFPVDSPPSSV
jgi:hypothetical protein